MIKTFVLTGHPEIIHHKMQGAITPDVAKAGAEQAIIKIREYLKRNDGLLLALDLRGYRVDNLDSHRIWSHEFKEHKLVSENITKVAIIGDESPQMRAEQELMGSETLRFFTDFDDAVTWLKA